ncbi:MAG: hypothetical protein AAF403_05500 [Pseudomonadota bacterium]
MARMIKDIQFNQQRLFCLGFGLSARSFAKKWQQKGGLVAATTRSADKKKQIEKQSVKTHLYHLGEPFTQKMADDIKHADMLLISTPPGRFECDPTPQLIKQSNLHLKGLIAYLSTTGVYGDHQGDWVDENTPAKPTQLRSQKRIRSEQAWLKLSKDQALGVQICCFRLAGIYGEGRNALLTLTSNQNQAIETKRIIKSGFRFGRIHSEDIANILNVAYCFFKQAQSYGRLKKIYNVCDDLPAAQCDVIAYACLLLNIPIMAPIAYQDADLSEAAKSFYQDRRLIKNELMKQHLAIKLQFKDYRAGLQYELNRILNS